MHGVKIDYMERPVSLWLEVLGPKKVQIISAWYEDTGEALPDENRVAIAVFRAKEIIEKVRQRYG